MFQSPTRWHVPAQQLHRSNNFPIPRTGTLGRAQPSCHVFGSAPLQQHGIGRISGKSGGQCEPRHGITPAPKPNGQSCDFYNCVVVYLPKKCEFVSWDCEIPEWKKNLVMFQENHQPDINHHKPSLIMLHYKPSIIISDFPPSFMLLVWNVVQNWATSSYRWLSWCPLPLGMVIPSSFRVWNKAWFFSRLD